jgi:hypothetical protein
MVDLTRFIAPERSGGASYSETGVSNDPRDRDNKSFGTEIVIFSGFGACSRFLL